jgi:single-strand DNA-binding protein
MDLNKVMIIGRLTRDPEARTTPNGHNVASFGVATNRIWTDKTGTRQQKVEYHNVVTWGRLADISSQYLHKGSRLYLEGRLQTREWEGQDGVKRYRTEIIAENMIMLDNKVAAPQAVTTPVETTPELTPKSEEETSEESKEDEVKVEDIPF